MRNAYIQQMAAFNDILGDICDKSGIAMEKATNSLLQADLALADETTGDRTGVLVEYAPAPRVLIYEIILGLFAALLIALLVVPETRERIGFDSRRHLAGTLAP